MITDTCRRNNGKVALKEAMETADLEWLTAEGRPKAEGCWAALSPVPRALQPLHGGECQECTFEFVLGESKAAVPRWHRG